MTDQQPAQQPVLMKWDHNNVTSARLPEIVFGLTEFGDNEPAALCLGDVCESPKGAFDNVLGNLYKKLSAFGIEAKPLQDKKLLLKIINQENPGTNLRDVFGFDLVKLEKKNNRQIQLFCKRCWKVDGSCSSQSCRFFQVLQGTFHQNDDVPNGKFQVHIEVNQMWFHDKDCTKLRYGQYSDLVNRCPGGARDDVLTGFGCFKDSFDYAKVVGDAYKPALDYINSFTDPTNLLPIGKPITFGIEKYPYDNRRNEYLPSTNYPQVPENVHFNAVGRILYYWINTHNLCFLFTPEVPIRHQPKLPIPDDNPKGHFYIEGTALIFGGSNINQFALGGGPHAGEIVTSDKADRSDQPCIHQILHQDFVKVRGELVFG
jgi:hypothetical protein